MTVSAVGVCGVYCFQGRWDRDTGQRGAAKRAAVQLYQFLRQCHAAQVAAIPERTVVDLRNARRERHAGQPCAALKGRLDNGRRSFLQHNVFQPCTITEGIVPDGRDLSRDHEFFQPGAIVERICTNGSDGRGPGDRPQSRAVPHQVPRDRRHSFLKRHRFKLLALIERPVTVSAVGVCGVYRFQGRRDRDVGQRGAAKCAAVQLLQLLRQRHAAQIAAIPECVTVDLRNACREGHAGQPGADFKRISANRRRALLQRDTFQSRAIAEGIVANGRYFPRDHEFFQPGAIVERICTNGSDGRGPGDRLQSRTVPHQVPRDRRHSFLKRHRFKLLALIERPVTVSAVGVCGVYRF